MSQIHQVEVFEEYHHEVDPIHGIRLSKVKRLKQGTTERISFNGETYEARPDGTFDVPTEVAEFFVGRPGWFDGPCPPFETVASGEVPEKAKRVQHKAAA